MSNEGRFRLNWPANIAEEKPAQREPEPVERAPEPPPAAAPPLELRVVEPAAGTVATFDAPADVDEASLNGLLQHSLVTARELSDAVLDMASNVRLLVKEFNLLAGEMRAQREQAVQAPLDLTPEFAIAVKKLAVEFDTARDLMEVLADEVREQPTRRDFGRIEAELDAVRNDLQRMKKRMPVRAEEAVDEALVEAIAERVAAALEGDGTKPAVRRGRRAKGD